MGRLMIYTYQSKVRGILVLIYSLYDVSFIKIARENPVLWTGMKGASAESRKKETRC
jgi:hypothetical protein